MPGEPLPEKPKLVWPGDPEAEATKSTKGELAPLASALDKLAAGLKLTVRNATNHGHDELAEQEAMERLAAYSFLARLLDTCEHRTSDNTVTE